jgi:hypothetical protein
MDTLGTVNSNFGAIEEAERQLRSITARSRENPDLRGAEEGSAQEERLERWMPDLSVPEFRRTCLPELRSYRANQLRQENRGHTTSKVQVKVPDTLMRQVHTVAEKNPHLFNDSKEFIDDFALLGINIGLYAFRSYPNAEDVVESLSWQDEEILRSLYRETQRMKTIVIFDHLCKNLQTEAGHVQLKMSNPMQKANDQAMKHALLLINNYPYLKDEYMEVVEKYFGPQSLRKFKDKQRKREDRGSLLAEQEGDPTINLSKRHLSLVTTGSEQGWIVEAP